MSQHKPHPYKPMNVNTLLHIEHVTAGINTRIAVALTKRVGTMSTAYFFVFLALLGFPALSVWLGPLVAIYVIWFSQTFLQLVMLPVLSVGQSVLGRHQEVQADEQHRITQKMYADIETMIKQNNEILAHLEGRKSNEV